MDGGGANLPPFFISGASIVMTDDDSWWWRRWLTDEEDAALQAGELTARERWRIAREIAQDSDTSADQIFAAMKPTEDQVVNDAIALINKVLAEPEPAVSKQETSTYRRDGSGHRRPLRARR